MSMAHGLEVRVPLIDHRLARQILALPGSWKLDSENAEASAGQSARRRTPGANRPSAEARLHSAVRGLVARCVASSGRRIVAQNWGRRSGDSDQRTRGLRRMGKIFSRDGLPGRARGRYTCCNAGVSSTFRIERLRRWKRSRKFGRSRSAVSAGKLPVSVIIAVRNEAKNLPRCLQALRDVGEVYVIDSQSTDDTVEIARSHGAQVVQFHYQGGWPKKRQWAMDTLADRLRLDSAARRRRGAHA